MEAADFQGSKVSESLGRDKEQTRMLPQHSLHLLQVSDWDILWLQWKPRAGPWRVLALPFSFSLLLKRRCWFPQVIFFLCLLEQSQQHHRGLGGGWRGQGISTGKLNKKKKCHFEFFALGELNPLRASADLQFQPLWVATRPSPLHPSCNSSSLCWGNRGSPYTLTETRYTL